MSRLCPIVAAILVVIVAQNAAAQVLELSSYPPGIGSVSDYIASSKGPKVQDAAKGSRFWKSDGLLRTPGFYYRLIGSGTVLAGAFVRGVAAPVFSFAVAPGGTDQNAVDGDFLPHPGPFAVGVQQMGKKPDWLSATMATALVMMANNELVVHAYKDYESHPSCFRLFTARSPHSTVIGVSFEW